MTSACDHFRYSVTTAATFLHAMLLCKIPDEKGDGKRQVDGAEDRSGDGDAAIGRVVAAHVGEISATVPNTKPMGGNTTRTAPTSPSPAQRCGVAGTAPFLAVARKPSPG